MAEQLKNISVLSWAIASLCGTLLSSCLSGGAEEAVGASRNDQARLTVVLKTSGSGTLAGGRILLTFTDGTDTLLDTLTEAGSTLAKPSAKLAVDSGGLLASAPVYSLHTFKLWRVTAVRMNADGSMMAADSASIGLEYDDAEISLLLLPPKLPAGYKARVSLPDSVDLIGTKQKLNISRFVLKIDGKTVADSMLPAGFFSAAPAAYLVDVGALPARWHVLEIIGYGPAYWKDPGAPLFDKSQELDLTASLDSSTVLSEASPGGGGQLDSGFGVSIGKVGTITMNCNLPSQIPI